MLRYRIDEPTKQLIRGYQSSNPDHWRPVSASRQPGSLLYPDTMSVLDRCTVHGNRILTTIIYAGLLFVLTYNNISDEYNCISISIFISWYLTMYSIYFDIISSYLFSFARSKRGNVYSNSLMIEPATQIKHTFAWVLYLWINRYISCRLLLTRCMQPSKEKTNWYNIIWWGLT